MREGRIGGEFGEEGKALKEILDNRMSSALMMQNQYMYWCNMMSMMYGGRPFPSPFSCTFMNPLQPQ